MNNDIYVNVKDSELIKMVCDSLMLLAQSLEKNEANQTILYNCFVQSIMLVLKGSTNIKKGEI